MFRSATFKLTMWYLALVMAISLVFSTVLYHVATAEIARGLHTETNRIFNEYPVFSGSPMLRPDRDINSSAHRILVQLVAFNVVVLFTAGWASYWLAKRTLSPIEDAHEQQKRFTADVSHELRTPLTALKMESEVTLMNKHSSKEELRQTLESNLEEASKLESLINNLLRLTRLEADELQQGFQALDVKDLLTQAATQAGITAKERKITIINHAKSGLVMGDQDSLVQLFVILLDNAVKYSSSGTSVTIASEQASKEVKIHVEDKGIGIDAIALEHVFDRFYRADNARTKGDEANGYGLGLSIAKMIADVHDGVITLSSRHGHGTIATVTLPSIQPVKN